MPDRFPHVTGDLEGWTEADRRTETVFRLPTARVEGHTVVYEDARGSDPGGIDGSWRFFFATGLTFTPPLAPGIGPASVLPTVRTESTRAFARRLRDRGFEDVEKGRSERVRVDTSSRARLRKYTARYPHRNQDVDVEGWTGVWTHRGSVRLAGGVFPTRVPAALREGLPERLLDPGALREELLALIRSVE